MTKTDTVAASGTKSASKAMTEQKVNRQEFLNLAWLASLGFLTVSLSGVTVLFSYPRFREGEFGGIFTFGPVANLQEVGTSPENFPAVKIWLSNADEGILALYKVCPHLGCIFGWNEQEFKFICPCHGSQFEVDGTYILGPAPRNLDRFIISIEDENGNVLAETPLEGGALPVPDEPNALIHIDTGNRVLGESHN